MSHFDTIITGSLAAVGVGAILLGIGSIIYATAVIEPHLEELTEQGLESVEMAERGLDVLVAYSDALGPLNPPQSNTLAAIRDLPTAVEQSANVSIHTADALDRSATSLRQIEDDLGIILPDNALQENAEALATSAESLRGLSPVLYRMHEQIDTVAADLTRASERAERLQKELQNRNVTLEQTRAQLKEAQTTLRSANFPAEITRLIGMVGGLFILLGVLLLGMAGLWWRLGHMPSQKDLSQRE